MKGRLQKLSLVTLAALTFYGCGSGTHENRSLGTKALYQVAANDKLVIRIEDGEGNGGSLTPGGDDITQNGASQGEESGPVAVATANGTDGFVHVHVGEPVLFSSGGTYDPDGEIVSYIWSDMDANVLSTDANFTRVFYEKAVYEKILTVIDDHNRAASARVCILADITADEIPLIADAGPDIVTAADIPVQITGHVVCKRGDFSYAWYEGEALLSEDAALNRLLAPGRHTLTFKVTDNATGMYALDSVVVTVEAAHPQGE